MKFIISSSYLFFIFTILLSCKQNKEQASKETNEVTVINTVTLTSEQEKNLSLTIDRIRQLSVPKKWSVSGHIITPTENEVAISVPYGGYVKQVTWMPGMPIKKGQLLTYIENEQFITLQEEYLSNASKLRLSQSEVNRQTALNKDKSSSDKIVAQVMHDYEILKINQKALAQKLTMIGIIPEKLSADNISKQIGIYAPIKGSISVVNVKKGQYVHATDVMFELIDAGNPKMSLKVFEKDLPSIYVGQLVSAHLSNDQTEIIKGKVQYIAPTINADHFAEVVASIESSNRYTKGSYVNAVIQSKGAMLWVVKEEAIIEHEGKTYLFIDKGQNRYTMTPCKAEEAIDGYVRIIDFSSFQNQNIVTKGAYGLLMKLKNTGE